MRRVKVKRILVLFPNEWDRVELRSPRYFGNYEFIFYGEDLISFPRNLRLLYFDVLRFIDNIVRRFERQPIDGVLSTDEYIGAIIAAAVARRLGLPGADPEKILLAQHKFFSRRSQMKIAPSAIPDFTLIPLLVDGGIDLALVFPWFINPVKGTFSLYARRVDTPAAARKHLSFSLVERVCLKHLTHPFNSLLRAYTDFEYDGNNFIGEQLLEGVQVTLDGYAYGGFVEILGVVDSVMFPGTCTFERFEYRSRLSDPVQQRMAELAKCLIRGMGIRSGQFNVEMFYNEKTDEIKVIEINPRLSYQFADLYENVDGCNTYDILLDLTVGRRPSFTRGAGKYAYAASFVFRTFRGKRLKRVPTSSEVEEFGQRYTGSKIKIYGRSGQWLYPEMKAAGSYRYAIVNTGAQTLLDLFAIHKDAAETLEFKFA